MQIPRWLERFRDWFNWGWLAYRIIWILVVSGILGSVGGAVWSVLIGVPTPIAIMAGYCTLVAAIYLALAPVAFRALSAQSPGVATLAKAPVDYKTWSHVDLLT